VYASRESLRVHISFTKLLCCCRWPELHIKTKREL
jgi:hypothetical protein